MFWLGLLKRCLCLQILTCVLLWEPTQTALLNLDNVQDLVSGTARKNKAASTRLDRVTNRVSSSVRRPNASSTKDQSTLLNLDRLGVKANLGISSTNNRTKSKQRTYSSNTLLNVSSNILDLQAGISLEAGSSLNQNQWVNKMDGLFDLVNHRVDVSPKSSSVSAPTGTFKCTEPFNNYYGYCMFVEIDTERNYIDATNRCAQLGGRLLVLGDLQFSAAGLRDIPKFKGRRFFIGGGTFDANLVTRIAETFKLSNVELTSALRRFSGKPTVADLNLHSPVSSLCAILDYETTMTFGLGYCDEKMGYICEQTPVDEPDSTYWTQWINSHKPDRSGDSETLMDIVKLSNDGLFGKISNNLCRHPLKAQCRIVNTNKLIDRKRTYGLKLDKPCEQMGIKCTNSRQVSGVTCPDLEVRFQCTKQALKDCATDSVRKMCEQQRKDCVMTYFGAVCVKQRSERTGKELIGRGFCTLNSITYQLYECSSRGDPHYYTPDGTKIDFQGRCTYNLVSTCNKYVPSKDFPEFRVTSTNQQSKPEDLVTITKAFLFELPEMKYLFTRGGFYVNGMQRNSVGYSDGFISINAQPKGLTYQLTIYTNFCLRMKWDNKHALIVYLPEAYKTHVYGICGNFDSDPKNDMTIPGSNVTVSADRLGRYHMVSGEGSSSCTDVTDLPKPCSAEARQTFSDRKYCGVFNVEGDSPFVSAVLLGSGTRERELNKARLRLYYSECLEDHCWMANFSDIGRCHEMEVAIEEIRLQLAIHDPNLDNIWRKYSDCENSSERQCGGKPNMEYSSSYFVHCQDTCADPFRSGMCEDMETSQGCVCKSGFYLDTNLNCVPAQDCESSCTLNTDYGESINLYDGETAVIEPCRKTITCQNGVPVEKQLELCSENGECASSGLYCMCRPGFKGNGTSCSSDINCRDGYMASGTKCLKLVREKLEWHKAAIYCGADGAHLARYDTNYDTELENFLRIVPDLYLLSIAASRIIKCSEKSTCRLPKKEIAFSVNVHDESYAKPCAGRVLLHADQTKFSVLSGCKAKYFNLETVNNEQLSSLKSITAWIGGCTEVLGPNKRNDQTPLQVDPPRLVDLNNLQNSIGCFQAFLNSESHLIVNPNPNCNLQQHFICEYDRTKPNTYDPNDFKGIPEKCNYQEAINKCALQGRPLATIKNKDHLDKVKKILASLGDDGWLSLQWRKEENNFIWSTGQKLTSSFSNFLTPPLASVFDKEYHCVTMNKNNGYWNAEGCEELYFPICGPPVEGTSTIFSPFYPVVGFSSFIELKQRLQRQGKSDYVCPSPVEMECSALSKTGQWITHYEQQGTTMTCKPEALRCDKDQELDCTTYRVRFLCPENTNSCEELKAIGANPCSGGRECLPSNNHYICQCPHGLTFNEKTQSCFSVCGECSSWGDPHYTVYSGQKYDFMGECKYLFTGVCDLEDFKTSPSFQVLTQNVACGSHGASCLHSVEIQARNIPVSKNGAQLKESFNFTVLVDASSYKLNNKEIFQTEYEMRNVFHVLIKYSYFELKLFPFNLIVLLSGSKFKVQVSGEYAGKLCGLCGDCGGLDSFKLRNGSTINVPSRNGNRDSKLMAVLATDWIVEDSEITSVKCKLPETEPEDKCSDNKRFQIAKLCDLFLNKTSTVQECFEKTSLDRRYYQNVCWYDACLQDDAYQAVCNMFKAFAQECSSLGVPLDWRRDHFCPMDCGKKVYRADASCEMTCGKSLVAQVTCQESPEEGCVCPEGLMKQGDNCVKPEDCGCKMYLLNDTVTWLIAPGESQLLPNCQEIVTCQINKDGSNSLVYQPYSLEVNSVCNSQIPPSVECAKGFRRISVDSPCQRDSLECVRSFVNIDGRCLKVSDSVSSWRQAVQLCNEEDGTLINLDSNVTEALLLKLFQDKKLASVYISGRVKVESIKGVVHFSTVLTKEEQGTIEWANFDFDLSLLSRIKLTPSVKVDSILSGGIILSLIVKPGSNGLLVEAVSSDTTSKFICQERKYSKEESQWFGLCNSDTDMDDDGDIERRSDLILIAECKICPVPKDIRCDINPNASNQGTVHGTCQLGTSGDYYLCNDGENCIDKGVSTECARDADECASGRHDCPSSSKCFNTVGSYSCICNEDSPFMVNGKCQAAYSCTMTGPETPLEYNYIIQGFSGLPGNFDYDCKFKIAFMCESYQASSGLPYLSFYDMSSRIAGSLVAHFSGSHYNPLTKSIQNWGVTEQSLKQGFFWLSDNSSEPVETAMNSIDYSSQTRFLFVAPNTFIIEDVFKRFKATISFPARIKIEFSEDYKDLICGACSVSVPYSGAKIILTEEEIKDISVQPEAQCSPRTAESEPTKEPYIPGDTTPLATTTIPSNPELDDCSDELIVVCQNITAICGVPLTICREYLCSGKFTTCSYLSTETFTSCTPGHDLKAFIEMYNCDQTCGPNMEFKLTTKSRQPTCTEPTVSASQGESSYGDIGFACVCDEGFLLSRTECVRQSDCGCVLSSGIYHPPGSQWRSEDCSELRTCLGKNEVNVQSAPCGDNTICIVTERGPSCQCENGLFGNPEVLQGCDTGEITPDGSKTCYNYVLSTGKSEERCDCNMGFVSNCDACEDIDECKEGLHDCDLSINKCINVPGGYHCGCADGFVDRYGECIDFNECTNNSSICPPNTQCVNTIGSFECKCCAGYLWNPELLSYDRDFTNFPTLPENPKCCAECKNPLCEESDRLPTPYCYLENGQKFQFPTYKKMYLERCILGLPLKKENIIRGKCPDDVPVYSESSASPPLVPLPESCDDVSLCSALPTPPADLSEGPVCGPSNAESPQTYATYCEMVRAVCKTVGGTYSLPRKSTIKATKGKCDSNVGLDKPTPPLAAEPIFTPWSPYCACQFKDSTKKCGEGSQMRNRQVVPYDDQRLVRRVETYETQNVRPCFVPCTNIITGFPEGYCPELSYCDVVEPLCGSVGSGSAQEFKSECDLNVSSCLATKVPHKLYYGHCDPEDGSTLRRFCEEAGPVHVAVKYDVEKDGQHCVGEPVTIGSCGNLLCDGEGGKCCRGTRYEKIQVDVQCYSLETKQPDGRTKHVYVSASECHCQPSIPAVSGEQMNTYL